MVLTALLPVERQAGGLRSGLATVVREEATRTVVVLRGEADCSNTDVLADTLARVIVLSAGDVVVDLTDAKFIDTGSGRVLAVSRQLLDRGGRALAFRAPSRLAVRVLDLFGLTELIEAGSGSRDSL